jgi:hypothetical protein
MIQMSVRSRTAWSVIVLAIFYAALHLFVLPPAGFFCGDQGPKYLQARAVADHGLGSPWIDGPFRDLDPDFRYIMAGTMRRPDNRVVSAYPWLLPVLTAPLLKAIGLYGLYLIPALSVIVLFIAARNLGRKLGVGSGLSSAWTAVAATPTLFYGAEFWDHAPAAAAVAVAANLLAPGDRGSTRRGALAGVTLAAGGLFREEAWLAAVALLVARAVVDGRSCVRMAAAVCAGMAAVMVASMPMNQLIYGSAAPYHLTSQMALSEPFLVQRGLAIHELLMPSESVAAFGVLTALALVFAVWRRSATTQLVVAHATVAGLIVIAGILPLWRSGFAGLSTSDAYRISSAAHTWPFAIALVYVGLLPREEPLNPVARYLAIAGVLIVALVIGATPSSGGSQWGPRYLLPAAPLLAVLVPLALAPIFRVSSARAREVRRMTCVVIAVSILIQVDGLAYLADAKRLNGRLTRTTEQLALPGDVIITDVGWYSQLIATLYDTRRPLLAWARDQVEDIAAAAAGKGFDRIAIIASPAVTGYVPPEVLHAPASGEVLYVRGGRVPFGDRGLEFHRYIRPRGFAGIFKREP